MPNWLLPLACLIILGSFIYVGFWKGLSIAPDRDKNDTSDTNVSPPGPFGGS